MGLCSSRAPDACLGSEEMCLLNAERMSDPLRQQLMPHLWRQHTVWLRSLGRFVQGHTAADSGLGFSLPQTNPLPLLAWPDRDGGSGTWCVRGQSWGAGGAAPSPFSLAAGGVGCHWTVRPTAWLSWFPESPRIPEL